MLDNYSSVDMGYLDFSKAFDKVDHGIRLHNLQALEICHLLYCHLVIPVSN